MPTSLAATTAATTTTTTAGTSPATLQSTSAVSSVRSGIPPLASDTRYYLRQRSAPGTVLVCTGAGIQHMPAPTPGATNSSGAPAGRPLYLCETFAAAGTCDAGVDCPDVHVDAASTTRLRPHFRMPDAPGARLGAPGQLVAVTAPNDRQSTHLVVDAGECLETRVELPLPGENGAAATKAPPAAILCGHFTRKRVCDYGAECRFVHALVEARPIDHLPLTDRSSSGSPPPLPAPMLVGSDAGAGGATPTPSASTGSRAAKRRQRRGKRRAAAAATSRAHTAAESFSGDVRHDDPLLPAARGVVRPSSIVPNVPPTDAVVAIPAPDQDTNTNSHPRYRHNPYGPQAGWEPETGPDTVGSLADMHP